MEFCEPCDRVTQDGVCVVHGEVETYQDNQRTKIIRIVEQIIRQARQYDYRSSEISSVYTNKILDAINGR